MKHVPEEAYVFIVALFINSNYLIKETKKLMKEYPEIKKPLSILMKSLTYQRKNLMKLKKAMGEE